MLYFLQTFTFVCLKFPNVQTISSDRREMNHFSDTLNFSYLSQLARVNEPRCLNTHKFWMMNPTNSEYWVLWPRPHNFNYDCVHVCVLDVHLCVCFLHVPSWMRLSQHRFPDVHFDLLCRHRMGKFSGFIKHTDLKNSENAECCFLIFSREWTSVNAVILFLLNIQHIQECDRRPVNSSYRPFDLELGH